MNVYARACINPYIQAKFDNDLKPATKAAWYFSPTTTDKLKPVVNDLDTLHSLSFFTSDDITHLKTELLLYVAVDQTKWWEKVESRSIKE